MIGYVIALGLAGLRVYGVKAAAFQAAAHLYVAWSLRGWWSLGSLRELTVFAALTATECFCFAASRADKLRPAGVAAGVVVLAWYAVTILRARYDRPDLPVTDVWP